VLRAIDISFHDPFFTGGTMRKASWIILTIVGALLMLGSVVGSANVAYFNPGQERIVGKTMADLGMSPEVQTAILARRGTAAGFAAAFGTLFLFIVLGPYRRGDVSSWWAILVGLLVLNAVVLLRIPILGTDDGSATALILLGISVLALLLDVKRLRQS
jgi:hypothetical protein